MEVGDLPIRAGLFENHRDQTFPVSIPAVKRIGKSGPNDICGSAAGDRSGRYQLFGHGRSEPPLEKSADKVFSFNRVSIVVHEDDIGSYHFLNRGHILLVIRVEKGFHNGYAWTAVG